MNEKTVKITYDIKRTALFKLQNLMEKYDQTIINIETVSRYAVFVSNIVLRHERKIYKIELALQILRELVTTEIIGEHDILYYNHVIDTTIPILIKYFKPKKINLLSRLLPCVKPSIIQQTSDDLYVDENVEFLEFMKHVTRM